MTLNKVFERVLREAQKGKSKFSESPACWINPNGEIIETHGSHTSTVSEIPETFGFTKEEFERLFNIGEENAVLMKLMQDGWIRIRYQVDTYFVSVNNLTESIKNNLKQLAKSILESHPDRQNTIVILDQLDPIQSLKILLKNILIGNFLHDPTLEIKISTQEDYNVWSLLKSSKIRLKS